MLNHALASALGSWAASAIDPQWLRWGLGLSFLAVAAWMLVPDTIDDTKAAGPAGSSVFCVTTLSFFLAEMGDKTQVATVMLAARYQALVVVTAGTTLGMMIANAPAVWLGERIVRVLPVRAVHLVAAAVFAVIGLIVLVVR